MDRQHREPLQPGENLFEALPVREERPPKRRRPHIEPDRNRRKRANKAARKARHTKRKAA